MNKPYAPAPGTAPAAFGLNGERYLVAHREPNRRQRRAAAARKQTGITLVEAVRRIIRDQQRATPGS